MKKLISVLLILIVSTFSTVCYIIAEPIDYSNINYLNLDKMDRSQAKMIIEQYKNDRNARMESELYNSVKKSYLEYKNNLEKESKDDIITVDPTYTIVTLGSDKTLYYANTSAKGGEVSGIGITEYDSYVDESSNTMKAITSAGSSLGSNAQAWCYVGFNIKTNGLSTQSDIANLVTKKDIYGEFIQEAANVFPSSGSSNFKWSVIVMDWTYSNGAPYIVDYKEFQSNRTFEITKIQEDDITTTSQTYNFKGNTYYTIIFKLECDSDSQGIAYTCANVGFVGCSYPFQAHLDWLKIDF